MAGFAGDPQMPGTETSYISGGRVYGLGFRVLEVDLPPSNSGYNG